LANILGTRASEMIVPSVTSTCEMEEYK
jgi:hypothetical protein